MIDQSAPFPRERIALQATPTLLDDAAHAWLAASRTMLSTLPDGFIRETAHGTTEIVTGFPFPALNAVVDVTRDPSPDEIAEYAASPRLRELPWSLQLRAAPVDEKIVRIAADHGLTHRETMPFMLRELTAADVAPQPGVRRVTTADGEAVVRTMAAGFESPEEPFALYGSAAVLELDGVSLYLVEADGVPVATALGVVSGDVAGVFNIAVAPAFRRRGYGRLATAAVLSDGYAAGARTAYLTATADGFPLYARMGFRHVETWSLFFPGE
jgi:N-acetylglutamate synthase